MIDINLVPVQYRKKRKKSLIPDWLNIPLEIVIGSFGAVFTVLVIIYMVFFMINMSKLKVRKVLQNKWESILSAKETVDTVIIKMRTNQAKVNDINNVTRRDFLWSQKLNIISDSIPKGVWLRKMSLSGQDCFIEGSAISKANEEMINIHRLAANLKTNEIFMQNIESLELESIHIRYINRIEVSDFLIAAKMKNDE